MTRLLLVIDDYNEMMYLQTLLKKLGFDVDSLTNTRKFDDSLLGFNPKFVVMTAQGKKVNGIELSESIVKRNSLPKILLLKSTSQVFASGELTSPKIDKVLETPVNILNLVKSVCDLDSSLNFEIISTKLAKLQSSENSLDKQSPGSVSTSSSESFDEESDLVRIQGARVENEVIELSKPKSTLKEEERVLRYQKYLGKLKDAPEGVGGFPKDRIKEYNKKHRRSDRGKKMQELDEHKKNFVKALFSHLKKSS